MHVAQSQPLTLETQRLALRPFGESNLDELATGIFGDPDVMRYLPKRDEPASDRARRVLGYFVRHWEEHGYGAWAVTGIAGRGFYGYCGLNYLTENGEVEVLYAFAKPHWGLGFATEAALASLWFGFEHANLGRIIGLVMPENIASRRVLEHTGMVYEGEVHYFGLDLQQLAIARTQFTADSSPYRLYPA